MAIHLTRDFISLNTYLPQANMYFVAIFMRTVLGYSVVGNTNFALDGATLTPGTGVSGQISASGGFTNRFTPDGYTVSASDVNRILCIKSPTNPLLNSGLWRVTGVDTANNQFILGLRGEPPVAETGLTWRLHAAESVLAFSRGTNSFTNQYRGRTSGSSTSRIIMQSSHASAYQVRLTYETATDVSSTLVCRQIFTIAPGYGGDSIGDFPVGGLHLHTALWKNQSVNNSGAGTVVGFAPDTTALSRYYFAGDDATGSMVMISRSNSGSSDCFAAFGLPEDEEYPNDTIPVRRLFVHGNANIFNGAVGAIDWRSGAVQQYTHGGAAFGYSGQPIFCAISTYGYLSGQQSLGNGPRFDGSAADNVFLAQTELQTVDLVAGVWDYGDFNGQAQDLFLEPRRMGRFPIARLGRSNFGDFTTATDSGRTWLHCRNGVYIPWYGSILP